MLLLTRPSLPLSPGPADPPQQCWLNKGHPSEQKSHPPEDPRLPIFFAPPSALGVLWSARLASRRHTRIASAQNFWVGHPHLAPPFPSPPPPPPDLDQRNSSPPGSHRLQEAWLTAPRINRSGTPPAIVDKAPRSSAASLSLHHSPRRRRRGRHIPAAHSLPGLRGPAAYVPAVLSWSCSKRSFKPYPQARPAWSLPKAAHNCGAQS